MLTGLNLITEEEFYTHTDGSKDHPAFDWMMDDGCDNDVFYDGMLDGYASFYNVAEDRPEPLTANNMYLFFKGVFMQDIGGEAGYPDSWKTGYVCGWCLGLGENNPGLFHTGEHHNHPVSGYSRLREEHGADVLIREEFRSRHLVMYILKDEQSLYTAEVCADGVLCSCPCSGIEPDCKHVCLIKRISPWFQDENIVQIHTEVGV